MPLPAISLTSVAALAFNLSLVPTAVAQPTSAPITLPGASTAYIAAQCTDIACQISIEEAIGFKPAAASFLATVTFPSDINNYVTAGQGSTLPTVAATDPAGVIADFKTLIAMLPTSLQGEASPLVAQLESLQTGDASASAPASAGQAAASTSSHAAASRPTDVALMAMAGVVAGVAGVAIGL